MGKLHVLVVEDDKLVGTLLAEMLGDMGHHVDAVVGTQDEAVEAARHYNPDVILLDEQLKSGYGSAAITQILGRRAVPYVLMSGEPSAATGHAAFLRKPFFEDELEHAIQKALSISL